jgi:hypothetical protein
LSDIALASDIRGWELVINIDFVLMGCKGWLWFIIPTTVIRPWVQAMVIASATLGVANTLSQATKYEWQYIVRSSILADARGALTTTSNDCISIYKQSLCSVPHEAEVCGRR